MKSKDKISTILYMGTYPPRECGIATFTKDLTKSINSKFSSSIRTKILAMNNDVMSIYNYSDEVMYQINDTDIQDYIDVAKKINDNNSIKLINIQHEFGIFGGKYGDFLIPFLELINKPVIITFHTVLPEPNYRLKKVVQSIVDKVEAIIVMTHKAIEILKKDYGVTKIIFNIPHGIPNVPFTSNVKGKAKMGFKDRIILSSFGMMGSGKGYEYVIEGLPEVIKKYPNLLYLIIGETHPTVRKKFGESYRTFLENKVKKLGLQNNVKFYNKYLKLNEILNYLESTDIYICSNLAPNQIVSGTLSYAMGCGRAVISTASLYAKDVVNHNKGLLVDFEKTEEYTQSILKLLDDKEMLYKFSKNSYSFSRHMTWDNVASSYFQTFNKYMDIDKIIERTIPNIKLKHMLNLTDDFGIIQFANSTSPDIKSGYTLDDNARALLVSSMHYKHFKDESKLKYLKIYLNFIKYVQQQDGKLYNYVCEEKKINYEEWTDDAHGRAIWALGYLLSIDFIPEDIKLEAGEILKKAIAGLGFIKAPRGKAFIINGLYYYNQINPSRENVEIIKNFANDLTNLFENSSNSKWQWFEDSLTYSNSKLPEAMFLAYLSTKDEKFLDVGRKALDFLISITFEGGSFAPIGQNGWYAKEGKKVHFDQQPVDAGSMVQSLIIAYNILKIKKYFNRAKTAFEWFLGNNVLYQNLYDESSGGCHDGLGESSINLNQGAESTIAYLIARLSLFEDQHGMV